MVPGGLFGRGQPVLGDGNARLPVIPRNATPPLPLRQLDGTFAANATDAPQLAIGQPPMSGGMPPAALPDGSPECSPD